VTDVNHWPREIRKLTEREAGSRTIKAQVGRRTMYGSADQMRDELEAMRARLPAEDYGHASARLIVRLRTAVERPRYAKT
jgi:hypothetical protein